MVEVEKPEPKEGAVRVRVHATTVCAGDVRLRKADPFFLRIVGGGIVRPTKVRIPGMEVAGTVDAIGPGVTQFKVGDAVFGSAGLTFGAYADYVCMPEMLLAAKPVEVPYREAAAIPFGGVSALHYLRAAGVQAGQALLIYGASGSVGTAAVQLGKHFGAHVTGVCSGANVELVRSLGADAVLDYAREDFSRDGAIYDVVFDTVGKSKIWRGIKALKRGGTYAFSACGLPSYGLARLWSLTGRVKVVGGIARGKAKELAFLMQLVQDGRFKPVIDRTYPLSDVVDAHAYAEAGHKKGNVVILVP
ncbi:MAG: NAD(P)-dependent alcohol dehydrogenase [Mycobacteriales bacterium]